jgi:S1-C subfamily serine protease
LKESGGSAQNFSRNGENTLEQSSAEFLRIETPRYPLISINLEGSKKSRNFAPRLSWPGVRDPRLKIALTVFGVLLLSVKPNLVSPYDEVQEQSVSAVVRSCADSIVLIVVSDRAGKEYAQGSGFIVSPDGRIVTNYHVIECASSAIVKLSSGAYFPVDGVLADSKDKDLALIKVSGKNLPALALADSNDLSIGEHVVAIGSPLGLQNTVTDGIVSAFRDGSNGRRWIQTTAPSSHGNSGGPLLNMHGKVVGVITLGLKEFGGENLNFAIPVNEVVSMVALAHDPLPLTGTLKAGVTDTGLGRIWTSLTTGKDYKVKIDGEYLYTDWVNIPAGLQHTGAFTRAQLKKSGSIWTGTAASRMPCQQKDWRGVQQTHWCSIETSIEITALSESRIEGRSQAITKFNCGKCRVIETNWKPFTWIPKD